jgi:hypothetical protein
MKENILEVLITGDDFTLFHLRKHKNPLDYTEIEQLFKSHPRYSDEYT